MHDMCVKFESILYSNMMIYLYGDDNGVYLFPGQHHRMIQRILEDFNGTLCPGRDHMTISFETEADCVHFLMVFG